nr:hypothetical protein [Tanacetum cinerariifolium]
MVNSSLKKLKFHLASFDVVVKERTTATAITEGTWGFEHTKACFTDEIIPFVKALKDLFNLFDQFLIDELIKVQNVFNQIEQAVEQHRVETNRFQDKMKQVLYENERLLEQAISTDIVNIVVNAKVNYAYEPMNECERCVTLETELQKDFIKKECYDKLFKQYTTLEKHCISLEVDTQLEQEIFQRNNLFSQQSVPSFDQLLEINDLKAQGKDKKELEEIKTIHIELDHRVTKLVTENEHLKQTYKKLYDLIKTSRVRSKEQCDDLIKQVNIKSAENFDLNASLQEKALVITALKNTLSKLKEKVIVDEVVTLHPIDLDLLRIDVASLAPKLRNNRTAHYDYLKHTQEETATLREIVENERLLNPLNTFLDYVCCDLLALVGKFTPVEDGIGLLETTFKEDVVLMGVFPDEERRMLPRGMGARAHEEVGLGARGFGTVPMCVRVQEMRMGEGSFLVRKEVRKDSILQAGNHVKEILLKLKLPDHRSILMDSKNRLTFYNNDEEHSIQYKEYLENSSNTIAPILPNEEPDNSLSIGDEHLSTISKTESDEVIKSSVKNLVRIPSESKVTSYKESECDVPVNDESSPIFTNTLFDCNNDFTSSDDESLSNEDVPMENFKIYSNSFFDYKERISTKIDPHYFNAKSNLLESLLNRNTLIDSSPKFDFLLEEFFGELAHIDPIPPGIEEADFDLEEEIRLSLSPSPIPVEDIDSQMEEIDLFLDTNDLMPPGIKRDNYDSEWDIYFLEELLSDDSLPLPKNKSSYFDHHNDPSFPRPPLEPPYVEIFFDFKPNMGV